MRTCEAKNAHHQKECAENRDHGVYDGNHYPRNTSCLWERRPCRRWILASELLRAHLCAQDRRSEQELDGRWFHRKLPKCFVGYLPLVITRLALLCKSWPRPSLIKLLKEIAEHFPGLVPKILGMGVLCELEHGQTNPMAYYLCPECRKGKRLVLTRSYLETHLGSLEICRICGLEVESL